MGQDRHFDPEERRAHRRAETPGEALVARMRHQGHAGGHQLGAGRLDLDVVEAQPVVGPRPLPVLHLGLGHRRLIVDEQKAAAQLRGRRSGGAALPPATAGQWYPAVDRELGFGRRHAPSSAPW